MVDVRRFQPAEPNAEPRRPSRVWQARQKQLGHVYPVRFLERLRDEMEVAWRFEARRSANGGGVEREALHDGKCAFTWHPRRRPSDDQPEAEPLLTPSKQSSCYLDFGADQRWYLRKDSCCGQIMRPGQACRPHNGSTSPYDHVDILGPGFIHVCHFIHRCRF